jgi:hypothetical protein
MENAKKKTKTWKERKQQQQQRHPKNKQKELQLQQAREWAPTSAVAARYNVTVMSISRYVATGRLPPPEYPLGPHRKLWRYAVLDAHDKAAAARNAAQMAAENTAESASAHGKRLAGMRRDRQAKTKPPIDKKPVRKPAQKRAAVVTHIEELTF